MPRLSSLPVVSTSPILRQPTGGLRQLAMPSSVFVCPLLQHARFNALSCREHPQRSLVVVRAGPPSTTTLIFAFAFPLSLLLATIFTSIRIADKLDQDFLEELASYEAMREEEDDQEEEKIVFLEPETSEAAPRTRNRPRREA